MKALVGSWDWGSEGDGFIRTLGRDGAGVGDGSRHQLPVLQNHSLVSGGTVHRCHFSWSTGAAAAETVQVEEEYCQDGAQEEGEEGGRDVIKKE